MPSRYIHVEDDDDCKMMFVDSLDTNSDNDKATVNFPTLPGPLVARANKFQFTAARTSTAEENTALIAAKTRMFAALEAIKQQQDRQE